MKKHKRRIRFVMDVELMTLGFLSSGPKTGYKLNQIFGNLMINYAISLNQIYPVLRNLEGRGLIQKQVVFQEGKPNKNLYTITDEGKQFLKEKLISQPQPLDYHLPFLVRALFFRFLDKEQICAEFRKEIESLKGLVDAEQAPAHADGLGGLGEPPSPATAPLQSQ